MTQTQVQENGIVQLLGGLKNVSDRDRKILEAGDESFVPFSWSDLEDIVHNNQLSRLSRKPSDLLYYLQCKQRYQEEYGGVLPFIIKERLQWDAVDGEIIPSNETFLGDKSDIKILYNDFPYGLEDKIVHVVVWSKAKIPNQPPKGDLTPESRKQINDYVVATFQNHLSMPAENILWFKNWAALQSVRAIDHFHVLLRNPPADKLQALIGTSGPDEAFALNP